MTAINGENDNSEELKSVYVDLHIHIGRTEKGKPVKISAASNLTFYNIAKEASEHKGIEAIGIIDCHSPVVQEEIMHYLHEGQMDELAGGGIAYGRTTVLLGSEIEFREPGMGPAHLLAYMPTLSVMQEFSRWMAKHMKNIELSSQRIYVPVRELQQEIVGRGGFLIPAHVFTPHRGIYGCCTNRMDALLDPAGIAAIELGLSADSTMAGYISELDGYSFVTNSDAHSLAKIGREYNKMALAAPTFDEVRQALAGRNGRKVAENYGLNPRLGKYHRTFCTQCESILDETDASVERCAYCGSLKIVRGVMDRILDIADREQPVVPDDRPPYYYQVPLEFIPGLGRRKMDALLDRFGTEMNILHSAGEAEIAEVAGEAIAGQIVEAREGTLRVEVGGGGHYGKVGKVGKVGKAD
jgi:uncharacterized protein (TIGR00375 family)